MFISFFYIDRQLANFIHQFNLSNHFLYLHYITHLGLNLFYVVTLFLLALVFRYVLKNRLWEKRMLLCGCVLLSLIRLMAA